MVLTDSTKICGRRPGRRPPGGPPSPALFASSILRKASGDNLFSCAMRSIERCNWVSSTRSPVSLALCANTFAVTSRSSSCRSRTSGAGKGVPWRFNCCSATLTCSSRSRRVTTSLLTTATTRSSITISLRFAPSCAAPTGRTRHARSTGARIRMFMFISLAGNLHHCGSRPCCRAWVHASIRREWIDIHGPLFVCLRVAADVLPQQFQRARTDPRQPGQLELKEHRVDVLLGCAHKPMQDEPRRPAAGIVLDPQQALQKALVLQAVVVARQPGPATAHRPFRRQVDLLQRFASEAIAEIHHFADLGLVAQRYVAALHLIFVGVVLHAQIGKPVPGDPPGKRCQHVGAI